MRSISLCIMMTVAVIAQSQTRSLIIDATGTVNDIVAAGQIGNASATNLFIDYSTGTLEITLPILEDLDNDYSAETAWYQIGVTAEIQASVFGDTGTVEIYLDYRTAASLASLASTAWTDKWRQDYSLADGESINDLFNVRFIADASALHGRWIQFRWELRLDILGEGLVDTVQAESARILLLDEVAPTPTPTPAPTATNTPTATPIPPGDPTPTFTPSPTHTFTPTPFPTADQIGARLYRNHEDTSLKKIKWDKIQAHGGTIELVTGEVYLMFRLEDELYVISKREL